MASTSDSRGNPVNPSDGERVRYVPRGSMSNSDQAAATGLKMENIGHIVIRYGVVIAVAWIGALKYTNYEEKGIEVLLVNSPLISWAYHLIGLRTLCAVIGTSELVIAALLAVRYFRPKSFHAGRNWSNRHVSHDLEFPVHHTRGVDAARLPFFVW
jgi:hypothetical protein